MIPIMPLHDAPDSEFLGPPRTHDGHRESYGLDGTRISRDALRKHD